ncbi:HNH endonuclease signature motif containing protein [Mycobacterium sp. ITM-2016-00317]|uniref:HNH endonuclease signature motif containing protein n=1 Tax=Mycobacterium sp. ITM-2016-00317 TaxID=2099694 RepID=UPI00287F6223|nr:HNH endonuclease signature motif containing protein [Mycobacterium sp. ITM-2016-00317]WNG85724.1 HNH endonuclease signature motif containing protein [Mycobacterium sp. ITM-2016-00317]
MFEGAEPKDLIDGMGTAARAESAAIAQRLEAVAGLFDRRRRAYAEAGYRQTDMYEAVAAEVSAAQNISRSRAKSQVWMAVSLYTRLPRVAETFARGEVDFRMVQMVLSRTENVGVNVIGALDKAIAPRLRRWMRLSKNKLRDRVDQWVADFDPAGVRVPPIAKDNRYFDVTPDVPGMAFAGGMLNARDAAALDQRLEAIAATVCSNDPRSHNNLRADAAGALGRGESALQCECGTQDCPAATLRESAAQVVIHILAEQATVDGTGDKAGYLSGFGVLPAEEVRAAAKTAKLKPVRLPGAEPEKGYRPSAGLKDFLQWRDLTCRFPGCDAPVAHCDVDHTTRWPFGVTHASGLKHYCRTHHVLKTFLTGVHGWRDEQRPDGTIVLTAPTGHVYTTEAFGGLLFPVLATPTASLPDVEPPAEAPDKAAMMPRRSRTYEQQRQARIARERGQRIEIDAERERERQAWLAATYEPPPF